jgi:hypothetical protein
LSGKTQKGCPELAASKIFIIGEGLNVFYKPKLTLMQLWVEFKNGYSEIFIKKDLLYKLGIWEYNQWLLGNYLYIGFFNYKYAKPTSSKLSQKITAST